MPKTKKASTKKSEASVHSKIEKPVKTFPGVSAKNNKSKLLTKIVILVVLLLVAWVLLKKLFIVAKINGEPIYRYGFVMELEQRYGKQLLDQKVTEKLVMQEASKNNVTISDEVINKEVQSLEQRISSQGQKLDELLTAQGLSREDLKHQIRMQKLVEALTPKPDDPTEEEIKNMMDKMAVSFTKDMSDEDKRNAALAQLKQQKQGEALNNWLDNLKKNAHIQYFRHY